jgi:outer membrane receptor for ferrienterochelin and colicins
MLHYLAAKPVPEIRMSPRFVLLLSVAALSVLPATAYATDAAPPVTTDKDSDAAAAAAAQPKAIVVTGHRLDEARASIQPSLGATAYGVDQATIQKLPGGDNQPLNQLILQVPGTAQDGFGQLHIRGDHNGLEYRINGTILPEGLAVFGQTLSPRLINSFNLLTGALPAQYGLRTAGIIDITTKTGFQNKGEISLYGGSHDTIMPSADYGGSTGNTNYFVSGSFTHNRLGIESVDGSSNPLHDKTDQANAFAYVDHILGDGDRISFLGGFSNDYFQIPNPRGLHAGDTNPGWNVDGQTDYLSNDLNERQLERTGFGAVSWLHHVGDFTWQTSLYARYSELVYRPDITGELLFNGQAQQAKKQDFTVGLQSEAAYHISDHHTLRGGVILSRDRGTSDTNTFVFPGEYEIDPTTLERTGVFDQTGQPIGIVDNSASTEWTESVYLQDEWKVLPGVTLNFGGRYDHYCGFRCEHQFSPRVNAVWQPSRDTTFHAGYARYFSPPPFENVATTSIDKFVNTSAAPTDPTAPNTTPYAERQNYFDVGVEQKIGPVTATIDGYYRKSRNLVDEGQFGAPIILTPFNYRTGKIYGIEGSLSYQRGPWLAYGNLAYAKARGKDIVSGQFNFSPEDLAYIQNHYIFLDHDQRWTGSAGISYSFEDGFLRGSKLGGDMLYGSGLRTDGAVPNGGKLSPYAQFNLTASHKFDGPGIEVRLDVTNVLDHKYEIRDGSGIGVGAPQYGPRRGVFVGVTKDI